MPVFPDDDALIALDSAGDTHIGQREHNEDTVLLRRELSLFVLADGAGGEKGGNVASSMAASGIAHYFEQTQAEAARAPEYDVLGLPYAAKRLSAAVHAANREIVELARGSDRYRGMGTTVVAASFLPKTGVMHLASVGDSRCYRLRAGVLELLTRDHSLATDVLELRPDLAPERAAELPLRVVTRALGQAELVRVDMASHEVYPGDRYLLCSDGLSDQLDDDQIGEALAQEGSVEARVRLLLEIANAEGARDNVAVVVVDCGPGPAASRDRVPVRLRGRRDPSVPPVSDYPEILVLEDDQGRPISGAHVVPEAESDADADDDDYPELEIVADADSGEQAVEAIRTFVSPLPLSSQPGRGERDPTIRFPRLCRKCGNPYKGKRDACPNCWDG